MITALSLFSLLVCLGAVWTTKRGRPLLGTVHVYQGHVVQLMKHDGIPSYPWSVVVLRSQDGQQTLISLMRFNIVRRRCTAAQVEAIRAVLGVEA